MKEHRTVHAPHNKEIGKFSTRFDCILTSSPLVSSVFSGGARVNQSEVFQKLQEKEEREMMGGDIQKDVIYVSNIPYKVQVLHSFRV
jgi:hypothetical protein